MQITLDHQTQNLKYMFKIIKSDENTSFDDIGFEFFNTDGSPDRGIEVDQRNFKEYEYTAEDLPEFTAFAVKIVGQGTNSCVVPMYLHLDVYGISIMGIKVEGHTHLIKNEESHAIINTDVGEYRLTMKRRQIHRTQRDEINSLKNDMEEIKSLLKELINKDDVEQLQEIKLLEEFRNTYNNLASMIGSINWYRWNYQNNNNLVDAINELENKTFFFHNFTFSTASQTVFNSSQKW